MEQAQITSTLQDISSGMDQVADKLAAGFAELSADIQTLSESPHLTTTPEQDALFAKIKASLGAITGVADQLKALGDATGQVASTPVTPTPQDPAPVDTGTLPVDTDPVTDPVPVTPPVDEPTTGTDPTTGPTDTPSTDVPVGNPATPA